MDKLILFTDGSVNTKTNIGYGASLAVPEVGLPLDILKEHLKVKEFKNTSSTKLELQTLLWALTDIPKTVKKVTVYTDSQNIMGLPGRRALLEENKYRTKKGKLLNNYALYQEFFRLTDQLDCNFVKVTGHLKSHQKDDIDRLFTLVDRASRQSLRGHTPLWYVYIVECVDNTLYTGITTDLKKRLAAHNSLNLGAKYTRGRQPVKLVYSCEFQTKSEALKEEYRIKQLTKGEKQQLLK